MKKIWIISGIVLVIGAVAAVRHFGKEAQSDAVLSEKNSDADHAREQRAKALLSKNGGTPMDLALARATSERQKQRIRDRLSYQSQTREQDVDKAVQKRAEIEARLAEDPPASEQDKLTRQLAALNRIIRDLD